MYSYVCTVFLKIPRSFSLTINACTNSIDQECKISTDHSDIATMIVHVRAVRYLMDESMEAENRMH